MAPAPPDRAAVLEDIRTLTEAPSPLLEQVERTLADGYACALEIQTERLRLQRRLQERARTLGDRSTRGRVREVADLAHGVARADAELVELREALELLTEVAKRSRAA